MLLVEDDPRLRSVLAILLEYIGHRVDARGTQAEALRDLDRCAFDAAVIDVALPDGSGLDVAAALRALPAGRRPRLIGISGRDTTRELRAAFDAFLQKPALEDDLRELLDDVAATCPPR